MRELPSGTVTFLFTDIEGSTRLLDELGAEQYASQLAEHRRVLREAFVRHGGVEVDTQGDAFFVAFATAPGALAAAREAQEALSIPVRMGIHTGTPLLTDEGYVGADVHRAARIAAAGHGGQVLVSHAARELAGRDDLRDLGPQRLKDLSAPERLWQLGAGDFPPIRSLNRTNLPVQPSALVGRERELAEITGLVSSSRLVTLTGAGGTGKTRLALQAAAELVEQFEDGTFWISLAALSDAALVGAAIGQALEAKVELADHVADKRMLLLLDNFEQLVDAAPALAELLQTAPKLHVLVTSRAPLRVEGESEYDVEPLPDDDAVTLFRERAIVTEPEEAVRELCRHLDGLPLAIELAAARTRVLPPDKLLQRLVKRLPILTDGRRDAPERHRTLRATIEWSYELLASDERQLFARLSLFAGSFELEAAEAVAAAPLDGLAALVEQSLLRRTDLGRFFMLETIREYALERLEASPEAEELARRHCEHYLWLAEETEAEARGPREAEWLRRLKSDQGNFRAALTWSLERGEKELALRLAGALHSFWYHAGFLVEGRRWAERALEAVADDELPGPQARALSTAGEFANLAGETAVAKGYLERSLALYLRVGDTGKLPAAYTQLGHVALLERDFEQARSFYERVLDHESSDPWCTPGVAYCNLGVALVHCGSPEEARKVLELALDDAREQGSSLTTVALLQNLAWAALVGHDLNACTSPLRESCRLLQQVPDPQLIWEGVELCAALAAAQDAPGEAARLYGVAAAQRTSLGISETLSDLGSPQELIDRARSQLGSADWEAAWRQGEELTPEQALEEALETLESIEASGIHP
jgi:predicted ATPase/class 3 adenylate cyclase